MGKKRSKSFKIGIMRNFSKAKKLAFDNRNYAVSAFLVILLFAVLGYVFPDFMIEEQQDFFERVVKSVPSDNIFSTVLFIIQNNLRASFVGMALGILVFVPFLMLAANGFVIGAVLNRGVEKYGSQIALKLLPHGIFELPAICIAAGFGIKIALGIFKRENLGENYKEAFLVYLFVVVPLVIIAGVIEGILFYFWR